MKRWLAISFATAFPIVFLAWPALAADDSHGGGGLGTFLFQVGNLALLLGVLVYFARKPLLGFFRDRRKQITGDLDQAAELLQTAENRYDEWQRRLIDLESETDGIREEGRRRAEAESEAILADARKTAERIQRDAKASIEHELRRAQAELRDEAAQLATEAAERILKERLGGDDRERLMDEFITRVETPASEQGTQ